MKKTWNVVTVLALLGMLRAPGAGAFAATDGSYSLSEISPSWDGTDANRLKARTAYYDYTYGDEVSLSYTLPWTFNFYGQSFSQIDVDSNGNVWFGTSGASHSFNLANTGRGAVISAWNNDLSSHFYGGVFVQHKTDPERVVIEWQTETYTEEGYSRLNNFETVIFPSGDIRVDYKVFFTEAGKDFGSGISKGDGVSFQSITTTFNNAYNLAGRSFSFTLPDTVAPALTLHTLPDNSVTKNPVLNITGGVSDAGSGLSSLVINGVPLTVNPDGSFNYDLTLAVGPNTIAAIATDNANNQATDQRTIVFDPNAPTLAIAVSGSGAGTVTSSPLGISCGSACSATFASAETITLTAAPASGSTFAGWSGGGCSGKEPCTITLPGDTTVYAIFAPTPPTITQPPNEWVNMGPEGVSATVVTIDPHDSQTVYLGTSNAGVFRSADAGATWSDISSDLPPYAQIYPLVASYDPVLQETILYAGTADGIFKSSNGGANWLLKNDGYTEAGYENTPVAMVVDPSSPMVLYVARGYGHHLVYKSTNGGETWAPLNVPTGFSYDNAVSMTVDPTTTPATLYLGTDFSGIYRSSDGGLSWSQANSGLPSGSYGYIGIVGPIAVDPTSVPVTLYARVFNDGARTYKGTVNTDGSVSWAEYTSTTLPGDAVIITVNTNRNPAYIYASGSGLHRSTNHGLSWETLQDAFTGSVPQPYNLTIEANQAQDTVYFPAASGIYKSIDSGANWIRSNNGIRATSVVAFAIDPGDPAILYAQLSSNKLVKSENGGLDWTETGLNPPWPANSSPRALLVDPTTVPSTVYAGSYKGIYRSTDGGATWQAFSDGLPIYSRDINKLIRDPRTNTIFASGYSSGIYRLNKSTGGSGTWQSLLYWNVYDFAVDPGDANNIYAGYGAVYKSNNGGTSWSTLVNGWPEVDCDSGCTGYADAFNLAVDPFNSGILYATSGDGLYRWDDTAMSWTRIVPDVGPVGGSDVPLFDPTVMGTMYLATDNGVFKSIDSGSTWQALGGADRVFYDGTYSSTLLTFDPLNPLILYATMRNQGSGVLRFVPGQ